MRYLFIMVFAVVAIVASFLGFHWYLDQKAAEKDYLVAEQRIADAIENKPVKKLNLSDLSKLKKIPQTISKLDSLVDLRMANTNVSDISVIEKLSNLSYLDLKNTPVTDLSPLSQMRGLTYLKLGHSRIFDLEPLAGSPSLKALDLNNTVIKTLKPLTRIESLSNLNLYASFAHDGSTKPYKDLEKAGVRMPSGNAYKQGYKPGTLYLARVSFSRLFSNFADSYEFARNMVIWLTPLRNLSPEQDSICILNNSGNTVQFHLKGSEDWDKVDATLPHNSWSCNIREENALISVWTRKDQPQICELSADAGKVYKLTGYSSDSICYWR